MGLKNRLNSHETLFFYNLPCQVWHSYSYWQFNVGYKILHWQPLARLQRVLRYIVCFQCENIWIDLTLGPVAGSWDNIAAFGAFKYNSKQLKFWILVIIPWWYYSKLSTFAVAELSSVQGTIRTRTWKLSRTDQAAVILLWEVTCPSGAW